MKTKAWLLPLLALLLAGCGAQGTKSTDPMAQLERRAMERWQLLIGRDFSQAYDYLTAGYRSTTSREKYLEQMFSRAAFRWSTAHWQGVECSAPDSCLVSIYATYTVPMPSAGNSGTFTYRNERWLLQDGQWQHLPE